MYSLCLGDYWMGFTCTKNVEGAIARLRATYPESLIVVWF